MRKLADADVFDQDVSRWLVECSWLHIGSRQERARYAMINALQSALPLRLSNVHSEAGQTNAGTV